MNLADGTTDELTDLRRQIDLLAVDLGTADDEAVVVGVGGGGVGLKDPKGCRPSPRGCLQTRLAPRGQTVIRAKVAVN